MKRRRFTLKGLMIAIAAIGVGIAALTRPIRLLGLALPLLLVTLYLTAVLGLVFRRGSKRAYWIGFALFGWAYLLLVMVLTWGNNPFHTIGALPTLLGDPFAVLIEFFMVPGLGDPAKMGELLAAVAGMASEVDDSSRFLVPCSVLGLFFAAMGGMIARAFHSSESAATRPADSSSTTRDPAA